MTLKKINLSALNANTSAPTQGISEPIAPTSAQEAWEAPLSKPIKLISKEEKTSPVWVVDETPSTQKKISLKDLKKSYTQSVSAVLKNTSETPLKSEVITPTAVEEIKTTNMQEPSIPESNILILEESIDTTQTLNVIGETLETISWEVTPKSEENTQVEEVLTISDGDTNCSIIKEEKSEIFWSYKWSFSQSNEEVSPIIVEAPVTEKEEIAPPAIVSQVMEERKIDPEKTNLERYADGEEKSKKGTKKKILISWMVWVLALWVPGAMFLPWGLLKSNVLETPVNTITETQTQEKIQEPTPPTPSEEVISPIDLELETNSLWDETSIEEEIISTIPVENTPIEEEIIPAIPPEDTPIIEVIPPNEMWGEVAIENNQIWNPEIVKENEEVVVDNLRKNTKMNPKVHNYLLEKYKK